MPLTGTAPYKAAAEPLSTGSVANKPREGSRADSLHIAEKIRQTPRNSFELECATRQPMSKPKTIADVATTLL